MNVGLWDWYAGQAMAGLIGSSRLPRKEDVVEAAASMADLMLAESEKRRAKSQANLPAVAEEASGVHPQLRILCSWWNELHRRGLVSAGVNETAPNQAVLAGWKRTLKTPELHVLLSDLDALTERIRESELCREGWFRLEKLLGGKNRAGAYIVQVLMEGGYASRGARAAADPFLEFARGEEDAA